MGYSVLGRLFNPNRHKSGALFGRLPSLVPCHRKSIAGPLAAFAIYLDQTRICFRAKTSLRNGHLPPL
jgi:hypothetical protein